jgi:metal-responsive CopG/Arc/MetJ family transcriptional regulator
MKPEREAFTTLLQVKTPPSFAEALDRAAIARFQSRSDFIRTALADRLRADGIEIGAA